MYPCLGYTVQSPLKSNKPCCLFEFEWFGVVGDLGLHVYTLYLKCAYVNESFHQVGASFVIGVPCYVGKCTIYYQLFGLLINILYLPIQSTEIDCILI